MHVIKKEVMMCAWQLTKASITPVLCLHLALLVSPISNFHNAFPCQTFRYTRVDVHYRSLMIRSKVCCRRSNCRSDCDSAGGHRSAPSDSAENQQRQRLAPRRAHGQLSRLRRRNTKTGAGCISSVFFKLFYTKDFIVFLFFWAPRQTAEEKGFGFFFSSISTAKRRSCV